ncbi:cytochrome P450 [Kalymmatonema gypsitolerans NIES-4073]|nr:cytochrome P450 [Scytonema sp. NIES-4073]
MGTLMQQKNRNHKALRPPLAKGLPVLGNALEFSDMDAFLRKKYLELGSVFRIRALNMEFVVLAGQEANLFFSKEGTKYFTSAQALQDFNAELGVSRSIGSMDGPDHAKYRNASKLGYSLAMLEQQLDQAVAIARREVASWSTIKPQPVFYLMQRIIIQQIGLLLTNYSPYEYLDDIILFSRILIATKTTRLRPGFMTYLPAYRRAKARVFELLRKVIAAHTTEPSGDRPPRAAAYEHRHSDLIDDLLQFMKQEPEILPTQQDRMLAVMNPFLAGVDTAASTAAFLLYALLKHPEILEQATFEANALFANGMPTPDSLRRLDVLPRSTLEALRMYPIAPAVFRSVTVPFEFAGYRIEAGQRALIATTVPHQLPEFYPNPFQFDIDRYKKGRDEHHRQPGVFAPFGLGPHMCLGMNFAQALIPLNIATILQAVRLEMVPANYQLRIDLIPTPSPDSKFQIRVAQRFEL